MATLNGIGEITLSKQLDTLLTLNTIGKYMDQSPQFKIGVLSGAAAAGTAAASADVSSGGSGNIEEVIGTKTTTEPSSGYYIKLNVTGSGNSQITTAGWLNAGALAAASTSGTYYFPVQAAQASVSGINTVTPSASISGSHVSLSNTNNGVSVTATGGGTASASVSATSSTAGYIPSDTPIGSETIAASSTTTSASSFISGVTLVTPESGTNSFSITVPNGNTTATFVFNVDANGDVTITES